jgi:hypothetical protein
VSGVSSVAAGSFFLCFGKGLRQVQDPALVLLDHLSGRAMPSHKISQGRGEFADLLIGFSPSDRRFIGSLVGQGLSTIE